MSRHRNILRNTHRTKKMSALKIRCSVIPLMPEISRRKTFSWSIGILMPIRIFNHIFDSCISAKLYIYIIYSYYIIYIINGIIKINIDIFLRQRIDNRLKRLQKACEKRLIRTKIWYIFRILQRFKTLIGFIFRGTSMFRIKY